MLLKENNKNCIDYKTHKFMITRCLRYSMPSFMFQFVYWSGVTRAKGPFTNYKSVTFFWSRSSSLLCSLYYCRPLCMIITCRMISSRVCDCAINWKTKGYASLASQKLEVAWLIFIHSINHLFHLLGRHEMILINSMSL